MTERPAADLAAERLHPAVVRAREARRRIGLPASLVDIAALARVNSLFEHVAGPPERIQRCEDDDAA